LIDAADAAFIHPHHERMMPELQNPIIRELIVYSYRVIYRLIEHGKAYDINIIANTNGA